MGKLRYRKIRKSEEETIDAPITEDSPYAEVRSAVPNVDNPLLPQNTIRMWVLGLIVVVAISWANMLFSLHDPILYLTIYVSSIVVWPVGRLWDAFVPKWHVFGLPLNPGPFNIKEHALITIMASTAFGSGTSYAAEIIVTLREFYKNHLGSDWGFQLLLLFSTQLIGLGMAGLVRRILVYPSAMIWPTNLVTVTFLTNIHLKFNHVANGWRISRLRLLMIVAGGGALYQWFPSFLAPFLSNFSFAAWIAPQNAVVNQLFGSVSGLGLFPLTFDWNQLSNYLGSPLIPPIGTFVNVAACMVLFLWIIVPVVHFSNIWFGKYLPVASSSTYDRFQQTYQVQNVLTNGSFDLEKYQEYSPLFMAESSAIAYGLGFASVTATIVHTLLFDARDIYRYWKTSRSNLDDVHMRLMRVYPEVSFWIYLGLIVICIAMFVAVSEVYRVNLGTGYLFLGLLLSAIMVVPIAFIYAMTNMLIGLNVVSEFMIGYIVPGQPLAMMFFKTLVYYTNFTAIQYIQNMKLGHYLKLAPRVVFQVQLVGALIGGIVQVATLNWASSTVQGICTPEQALGYTCPQGRVFYYASIIWGVIGPARYFKIYRGMLYFFFIGAVMPLLSWLWLRKWPRSSVRYLHWPVFFNATGMLPPATPYNYSTWCLVGFLFGFYIKRNWFNWWAKYNYTLSAALDLSIGMGQLIIFAVSEGAKINSPNWWGTTGVQDNMDAQAMPMIQLPPGEWFGPTQW